MKRREFIALIGGAATGWPFVARAQRADRVRHIGVLSIEGESGSQSMNPIGPFLQALRALGWNDGRNIRVDARHFGGDPTRAGKLAKELIELNPYVLLARGTLAATALRQYTLSIPIIFVRGGSGSLNRIPASLSGTPTGVRGSAGQFAS